MIFFKPNICFKIKSLDETVADFCTRLKYSNNNYEQNVLKDFLCINEYDENNIKAKLKIVYNSCSMQGEKQLKSIQNYWEKIKDKFFNIITQVLDVELFGEMQAYCLIDCLPLPMINFKAKRISLPLNENLDDNVKLAISHLVKCFLLNKFVENNPTNINMEYNRDSVYWIMADLVADSLFYHTDLKEFATNTAYKYYYGLKIKEENLIDFIRNIFPKMKIMDFMQYVLDFVANNMTIFNKFTNRY